MDIDVNLIKNIAYKAGEAIMEVYNSADLSVQVDYKSDNSPLTLADRASHGVIEKELKKNFPGMPVISEEGSIPEYSVRSKYAKYWLIDPLDGTKEFIKRNGEFTVNIALIEHCKPVLGVVYAAATDSLYCGYDGKCTKEGKSKTPKFLNVNNKSSSRIAVRSKSHASSEEEEILARYDVTDSISVGSSLKFCMIAEGKADIYYRHGPTMEWDTAAGQAVLEAAGGQVFRGSDTDEWFKYNKADLLNGSFLGLGFPVHENFEQGK